MEIRNYKEDDLHEILEFSLKAWEPVFKSIKEEMGEELYQQFYPDGWRASQKMAIEQVCKDAQLLVLVCEVANKVVGFTAIKTHEEDRMGEIYMIAVDPEFQKTGIGNRLTEFSLVKMKELNLALAMVETGNDPGHERARKTYEKSGFNQWPVARYFKKL